MKIISDREIKETREKGRKTTSRGSGIFSSLLSLNSGKSPEDEIRGLLSDVEKLGQELAAYRSTDCLERYKKKVKEFITELMKNYEVITVESEDGKKIHQTISLLNQKLEEISVEAMNTVRGNAGLVSRIDEIRGLMIDAIA